MNPLSWLLSLVILWGPILLALTAVAPVSARGWSLHLVSATALAWLVTRALTVLFFVPIAAAAPGRYRVIPRFPAFGVLSGAMGVALVAYGAWRASEEGLGLMSVGIGALGLLCLRNGKSFRELPIWESSMTLRGEALRIEGVTGAVDVPLRDAQVLRRRRDGSFLITTAGGELDTLVLTRKAGGRYWVDDAEGLLAAIMPLIRLEETDTLLSARTPPR
ncbi:hypothetical protein L6R49_19425 [Myxococcota bacterium]|nr:hypothetical protein [Myxococcota bacterium]